MQASPREVAATDAAQTQAALQAQILKFSLPEIQKVTGMIQGMTGGGYGEIMPGIHAAFEGIGSALDQDYQSALTGSGAAIRQRAKQSGMPFSTSMLSDATTLAAKDIERSHDQAKARLGFAEAQTNLGEFNTLMNLLGGGSQAAFGLGGGMGSIWNQAISGMSSGSTAGGILGGAAGGAAAGTAALPGWGTAIGAILGGLGGIFGGKG